MPRLDDLNSEDDSIAGDESHALLPVKDEDAPMKNGDDEEVSEEDEDEDEYVVERIEEHEWDARDKVWKYKTKWQGWDADEDRTWEPKENLVGAQESLDDYWDKIGGEPDPNGPEKKSAKKRGRASVGAESGTKKARVSPVPGKRRSGIKSGDSVDGSQDWGPSDEREWDPPKATKDAWEEQLIAVETIEPDEDGNYWAYLRWAILDKQGKNRHTKHPLSAVYKAAPQTMLKFYEKHLVFSEKNKR